MAVAAVVGRTFDAKTVAVVSDLGIDRVVEALDAAVAANLGVLGVFGATQNDESRGSRGSRSRSCVWTLLGSCAQYEQLGP